MGEKKSETHVKSADLGDMLVGDVGDHGEKLEHGHPVTETVETESDDDEDED